jgi:lysine biosynthesis protein LysW
MATCPECDAEIEIDEDDLDEMEIGDPWDCDACGSTLRVASLEPLDFETEEEDDDDEKVVAAPTGEEGAADDDPDDDDDDDGDEDKEGWDE